MKAFRIIKELYPTRLIYGSGRFCLCTTRWGWFRCDWYTINGFRFMCVCFGFLALLVDSVTQPKNAMDDSRERKP